MKKFATPCLFILFFGCQSSPAPQSDKTAPASFSLQSVLGNADLTGFARADKPRTFAFPQDHGPHPDFRSEWWYITGNVDSSEGPFGFELTFFRQATAPTPTDKDANDSAWQTNQIYMAHAALSDITQKQFYADERLSRGALGLAGAQAEPFKVWLDDWSITQGSDDTFQIILKVKAKNFALELQLTPTKELVLQGDAGLSQKGQEPGNASYYYSFTNMQVEGKISRRNDNLPVRGKAWMDREWSSSVLDSNQVGWDWFALQLNDEQEIMLYQLRKKGGGISSQSGGTIVAPNNQTQKLNADDTTITVTHWWTNPKSQTTYPAGWQIKVKGLEHTLHIKPRMADQELRFGLPYWEGAVDIFSQTHGQKLGHGYVELTGYAK
ncbi:MAG: lipocalin-like domain-containing protein [Myxococcota bacterium]|jgi:predicted secreted hydrolase|nr:lipocalin-like domain-containing protein [Myxococcota bacterium]